VTPDQARWIETENLVKTMRRELEALQRALPGTYDDKRWGVMNRNSAYPDTPRAVFQYQDDAYAFARLVYGQHGTHDFEFKMPPGVEVVPLGDPLR
jgi:hypothetical protein